MRVFRAMVVLSGALIVTACERRPDVEVERQERAESRPDSSSKNESTTTAAELLQFLAIEDDASLVASLNEVKRRGASMEALAILEAVWREDIDAYPNLAWAGLLEPLVRLNIIDILVQAARNGEIAEEPEGAHEAVRALVQRSPPMVASQGLITLASFDRADDVPLIASHATGQNDQMFRSAVIALSMMCANTAAHALERIESGTSPSNRSFVEDTVSRMSDYKRRTRQCE